MELLLTRESGWNYISSRYASQLSRSLLLITTVHLVSLYDAIITLTKECGTVREIFARGSNPREFFFRASHKHLEYFQIFFFAIPSLSLQGNMTAFSKDRHSIVWFSIRSGEIIELCNFFKYVKLISLLYAYVILFRQSIHIYIFFWFFESYFF